MTEEEIRIIVDRVFTELRNNSKTIMQLSEKTEVDNCWFEIDNGYRISLATILSKIGTGVYPKVLKWSGIIIENATIQPGNASTSSYNNIKFVKSAGCFAYEDRGILFRSWHGSSDYYDSGALTKNIFVDMQNNVWIADSASTIKQISSSSSNSAQYCDAAKWSGKILDDDTTSYIVDNTDLSFTGLKDPSKIVFKPLINSFLYQMAGDDYFNCWDNIDDFQAFPYPAENQPPFGEFNPGLKTNVFTGIDGSYWIANSDKTIKFIGNTLDIIDGEYDPSSPSNFQPVADKILTSPNFMARIEYRSSATSSDIIFFRGCLPEKAYDFSTSFPLTLVGTSTSGNTYLMMRYDKEIEIVKIKTFSQLKNGDIVLPDKSTMTLSEYKSSGKSDAIGVVFDKNKGLFVRKNIYSGKLVGNNDPATGIFYGTVGCKAPYDGRTTQKLNLLHSSNPSVDFPVFNYAEQNGWYVAANGELEKISNILESLTAIDSDFVSMSNIASCTQRPKATSSASVFYGGAWGASDYRDPSTTLNYLLIDIL